MEMKADQFSLAPEQPRKSMLRDILEPGLHLIICGSAAGARSAAVGAYYAGRGNSFWHTLAAVGLTPRQLQPSEFGILPQFGIGLTDLVKCQAGSDEVIDFGDVDRRRLEQSIVKYRPHYLCFNGKRAAQEFFVTRALQYGLQSSCLGTRGLFVAPSTSGAARASWDLSLWRTLADLVRKAAA